MEFNSILSGEAVEAHTEVLKAENYNNKEFFENLIDRICVSVTDSTVNAIISDVITNEFVSSFDGYEGILEDVKLTLVNLWYQIRIDTPLAMALVNGEYVPAVCPFIKFTAPFMVSCSSFSRRFERYRAFFLKEIYLNWYSELMEKERVEQASPESAIHSMRERLFDHVKTRLTHYYNTRNRLEAIGTPYFSNKLLVKFKSPTKGARVMYTPIYNLSPEYTNGFTSPTTAYMDPGTYELRVALATGTERTDPYPHAIHKSGTIQMTV